MPHRTIAPRWYGPRGLSRPDGRAPAHQTLHVMRSRCYNVPLLVRHQTSAKDTPGVFPAIPERKPALVEKGDCQSAPRASRIARSETRCVPPRASPCGHSSYQGGAPYVVAGRGLPRVCPVAALHRSPGQDGSAGAAPGMCLKPVVLPRSLLSRRHPRASGCPALEDLGREWVALMRRICRRRTATHSAGIGVQAWRGFPVACLKGRAVQ